jgi:hypothetical protein
MDLGEIQPIQEHRLRIAYLEAISMHGMSCDRRVGLTHFVTNSSKFNALEARHLKAESHASQIRENKKSSVHVEYRHQMPK